MAGTVFVSDLPTGTVTFFFSDIEGSTRLLQRLGDEFRGVLDQHYEIGRAAFDAFNGVEIRTEGDAFFTVFTSAQDACDASARFQRQLDDVAWPDGGVVKVRIGLHTGIGELGGDDYLGLDVHLAARIAATGHGGQVVVSEATKTLTRQGEFIDLGSHRLKDIEQSERLYQLVVPGLPSSFPPLRTLDTRTNNLPILPTQLIGRSQNKAELLGRLSDHRLVSVVGPGGVGKTHLAISVAADAVPDFEAGVFFVDLAPISDPSLVLPAIASTLEVDATEPVEIARSLADGKRLVLLDNLEQVIDVAPSLAELMAACPSLSLLATSQVPLRISGEVVVRLEPLGGNGDSSAAIDLFASRALAVDPSFTVADHADDVAALVVALDGLPLALELAAARLNVLTPAGILERLQRGATVLESRTADASERHRSLEDAIAWSYDLLAEDQQSVLRSLSVFRGGATLDGLESVAGRDVLDELGELVDRSLVRTMTGASTKRFDVFDAVRRFAEARLREGDAARLVEAHTDFFMELATSAAAGLVTDRAARWVAALEDDHENLQAVLGRLVRAEDADRGLWLLGTIWRYFQTVGRIGELRVWLDRFFGLPTDNATPASRAMGLSARAAVHYWAQDFETAVVDYRSAVHLAEGAGDPQVEADAWFGLASSLGQARQVEEAFAAMERTRQLYEALGDSHGLGGVATFGAFATAATQGMAAARDPLTAAAAMWESSGNFTAASQVTLGVAAADLILGDLEAAKQQVLRCFDLAERAGDRFMLTWACRGMGLGMLISGDVETGALLIGAAEAARERMGGGHVSVQFEAREIEEKAAALLQDPGLKVKMAEGAELSIEQAVAIAREAVS